MNPVFASGSTILRREVLNGEVWLQSPVTVIADDGTELAVLLEPGSTFTFPEHPFGPHPWASFDHWTRTAHQRVTRAPQSQPRGDRCQSRPIDRRPTEARRSP
jgi:hypothetical protein